MGARFSQNELRKAVDVAKEKGFTVERFVIRPDGTIVVDMAREAPMEGDAFDMADLRR